MIAQIPVQSNRRLGRDEFPSSVWEAQGLAFQFIQIDCDSPNLYDVSIQSPFRRFLGRIEFNTVQEVWIVSYVERQPHSSRDIFVSWQDATEHLNSLVNERRRTARIAELRA